MLQICPFHLRRHAGIKTTPHYQLMNQHPQSAPSHPVILRWRGSNKVTYIETHRFHSLWLSTERKCFTGYTIWFEEEARPPGPSVPYIIKLFGMLLTCCIVPVIATPSPVVWVDGVDGGELEGPTVFPVPVLFAGPEEVGCFLFRLFWITCQTKRSRHYSRLLIIFKKKKRQRITRKADYQLTLKMERQSSWNRKKKYVEQWRAACFRYLLQLLLLLKLFLRLLDRRLLHLGHLHLNLDQISSDMNCYKRSWFMVLKEKESFSLTTVNTLRTIKFCKK